MKRSRLTGRIVFNACVLLLVAFAVEAPAATITWNGNGVASDTADGNDLSVATKWNGNSLPTTNDNAHIIFDRTQPASSNGALTNKTTDAFSVMNLVISNLASRVSNISHTDTVTFSGTVTLSSNLVVGAISGVNNYSLGVIFSNTLSMINGTFNGGLNSGGTRATASLTFAGTTSIKSNLTFSGNTGFSALNINGTTTVGSNLTFTGGTGTNLLQITSPTTVSNNFAITGNAGAAASNLVNVTGNLTVLKTLSLTNGSSRNTLTLDAANINLGTLTVSGSGATPYLIVGAGRTITINNDFITDSVNLTNGTLKIGGALTINTLNANRAGFQAQNGTITFNGGGSRVQTAEVASVGTSTATNYLIGNFQVGDSGGVTGNVRLVDGIAGNNASSPQQLLANNLRVFAGGTLDINGLSAAFQNGTNAGTIAGITSSGRGLEVLGQLDSTGTIVLGGGSVLGTGGFRNTGLISGFGTITPNLTSSGTITPSGVGVTFAGLVTNSGLFSVGASSATLSSGLANSGTVSLGGGSILGAGNVVNTGTISGFGAIAPTLNNSGTIDILGGTLGLNLAPLQNGRVNIASSGTLSVGTSWANGGVLSLNSGRIATSGDLTNLAGGTIQGNGTISGNLINQGTISPGFSVGALTLNDNLNLGSNSTVVIELSSLASFDKVTVTGNATLGGNLQIILLGGYTPNTSDSWAILTATAGLSGSFASITDGYLWQIVNNELVLTAVPEANTVTFVGGGILLLAVVMRRRHKALGTPAQRH